MDGASTELRVDITTLSITTSITTSIITATEMDSISTMVEAAMA